MSRDPRPRKVIFENGSEFKRNFISLLKYFAVKTACTAIKNPQANAISDRIHQFVGRILKNKDPANVTFDAVSPWSEILSYITYALR